MENNNQFEPDKALKTLSDSVFDKIEHARKATGVDFSPVLLDVLRYDESSTDCKGIDATVAVFVYVIEYLDKAVTSFQLPSVGDQHLDKELFKTLCRECPVVLGKRVHMNIKPWRPTPLREHTLSVVVDHYFSNKGGTND